MGYSPWLQFSLKKLIKLHILKNLIVGLYILYVINTYFKFHVNQMLFTIRSLNLLFILNLKLQKLEI